MTKDTIKELNSYFMKSLLERLRDKDCESLTNEFSSEVSNNGFKIFSTPAGYFANAGRKAGKMPSIEQITPSIKKHNIPMKAAFPIAKSIGDNGTEGKHFMDDFDKEMDEMVKKLTKVFKKDIINLI